MEEKEKPNKYLKLCQKCHSVYTAKRKWHIPFCQSCLYPSYQVPLFYKNGLPQLNKQGNQKHKTVKYSEEQFKDWLKNYPRSERYL